MINGKNIELRPMPELFAMVKSDLKKFDMEGMIDEGNLIKTVMWCNEKLGLHVREIREVAIPVIEYKAKVPLDFEKLFYLAALEATGTSNITLNNPFDNNFDQDIIYEASLDRASLGCAENYMVTIKRESKEVVFARGGWVELNVTGPDYYFHVDCPNRRKSGKYSVQIKDGEFELPFRSGTLYMLYIASMKDSEGNILYPFHPLITPYYEWSLKEKIISDMIFNSDQPNIAELFKLSKNERTLAWLDAYNFSSEKSYAEFVEKERRKELSWYNEWFKYFQ